MKKRFLNILIIGAVIFSFSACGKDTNELNLDALNETTETEEVETTDVTTEELATEEEVPEEEENDEFTHSQEYDAAFELDDRYGAMYAMTGDAEVSEFGSWQEGYISLVNDMLDNTDYQVEYELIFVDDDDIPEMAYHMINNGQDYIYIATSDGQYVCLFSTTGTDFSYIENANDVFFSERVEASYYDYVIANNNGAWINIGTGVRKPLDQWAEDSFDENGEPIISSWKINNTEYSNQAKYDDALKLLFDQSYAVTVTPSKSADEIIEEIENY